MSEDLTELSALAAEMRQHFGEVAAVLSRQTESLTALKADVADVKADLRAIHHHMAGFSEEVHALRLRVERWRPEEATS